MIRIVAATLVVVLGVLAAAMTWQHGRYLHIRRELARDRQALLHSSEALHVVSYLRVAEGQDPLAPSRALASAIRSSGRGTVVYAGRVALVGIPSAQLPAVDWDVIVFSQFESREAWDEVSAGVEYRTALEGFEETYAHGMERWRGINLAVPQALLGVRVLDLVKGVPRRIPFAPAGDDMEAPDWREEAPADRERRLRAVEDLGRDAIVIVNLLAVGTPEQQRADRRYGLAMAGMFAEAPCGPLHVGSAVRLEGEASYDRVAIVYYPGVEFLLSMLESEFFTRISTDKQPGDTLAVITVPITPLLDDPV